MRKLCRSANASSIGVRGEKKRSKSANLASVRSSGSSIKTQCLHPFPDGARLGATNRRTPSAQKLPACEIHKVRRARRAATVFQTQWEQRSLALYRPPKTQAQGFRCSPRRTRLPQRLMATNAWITRTVFRLGLHPCIKRSVAPIPNVPSTPANVSKIDGKDE